MATTKRYFQDAQLMMLSLNRLIDEGKLIDALALSDRCLRDGASDNLLRLLIEREEENHTV
ncbi:hypothetical protein Tco_1343222, partial [Tanacetum coccineum]